MSTKTAETIKTADLGASSNFSSEQIPDLTGKTAIVTGGNTGIGYETCLALVQKGATVFMASRSRDRALAAIEKIEKETQRKVEFLELNLQDLKQVRGAAQAFLDRKLSLDILVNNAGIMACPFALTKDGIETQFGTNHTLLPALQKGSKPRVVNVSSAAHNWCPKVGIDFGNLNSEKAMSNQQRYGQSKLANILFTKALQKKHPFLTCNAIHPGVVDTELARGMKEANPWLNYLSPVFWLASKLVLLTPKQGATASLYAATSPEIETKSLKGHYFVEYGRPGTRINPLANDEQLIERLWTFTESLVAEKLK